MPFPVTHLLVADALLTRKPRPVTDAAQFMLGALAPDAVHYRKEFMGAAMKNIGPAKKITHLCPVSEERWGSVTDNEGWMKCVQAWARGNTGSLADGYVIHVLTDLYNNMTLWENFRTNHPAEAAKGYTSGYYRDMKEIDLRLYMSYVQGTKIEQLLANAVPCDMPGLALAEEILAIRDNILYENYKGRTPAAGFEYSFVTYDDMLSFIAETVTAIDHWLV